MNSQTNKIINDAPLTAIEKLAVRTMMSALDVLKQASESLDVPIDALTVDCLMEWIQSDRRQ